MHLVLGSLIADPGVVSLILQEFNLPLMTQIKDTDITKKIVLQTVS